MQENRDGNFLCVFVSIHLCDSFLHKRGRLRRVNRLKMNFLYINHLYYVYKVLFMSHVI